jgi:hypothetical protein
MNRPPALVVVAPTVGNPEDGSANAEIIKNIKEIHAHPRLLPGLRSDATATTEKAWRMIPEFHRCRHVNRCRAGALGQQRRHVSSRYLSMSTFATLFPDAAMRFATRCSLSERPLPITRALDSFLADVERKAFRIDGSASRAGRARCGTGRDAAAGEELRGATAEE